MTYNWNTMVEITVPTGTNGWLYSGEVIINGVKVRFPVGVPTSVPEPAAVLLKKMIELEQEENANTAKPQNHYVGDMTIPAGKTLTLEAGAKFVDNSGPSEVVILPETELTHAGGDDPKYIITTPPSAVPVDGVPVNVTYNGVVYTCPVLHTKDGDYDVYAMGNLEIIGETGGDSDAPFCVVLSHAEAEGVYGMCFVIDSPQAVTLSIVQTEGAASGGGESMVFVTRGTLGDGNTVTLDKTYDELVAAYKAGKDVRALVDIGGLLITMSAITLNQTGQNDLLYFSMYMKSGSTTMWAALEYDNNNNEITFSSGS